MLERRNRISGALYGAAIGNAMGAATESYTPDLIIQEYGQTVKKFVRRTALNYANGTTPGTVTADFSVAYITAQEMLANNSRISSDIAVRALLKWHEYQEYVRYIGSTSEHAFFALLGQEAPSHPDDFVVCRNERATNGAAMKAGLMGIFNIGNVQQAVRDAIVMCQPTHNNVVALSGACAVAAAVACAASPERISYLDVIREGLRGAREGMKEATAAALPNVGCSVEKRMQLAVEIGLRNSTDHERAMRKISELIGCGSFVFESVPAVFGMIAASGGNAMDTILMAVNAGDDSDTTACIAGYICGALNGMNTLDQDLCAQVDDANHFRLLSLAERIENQTISEGIE